PALSRQALQAVRQFLQLGGRRDVAGKEKNAAGVVLLHQLGGLRAGLPAGHPIMTIGPTFCSSGKPSIRLPSPQFPEQPELPAPPSAANKFARRFPRLAP
ncbi:MAG: hypothetical protein FWJ73_09460, partial [Limnochordales bacterium]